MRFASLPEAGVSGDPDRVLDGVRLAVREARQGRGDMLEELGRTLIDLDGRLTSTGACRALAIVSAAPSLVLRLDKDARSPHWAPRPNWVDRARRRLGVGGVIAAALASMHGDGRVREAAVARMVGLARPETGPFMVADVVAWARHEPDPPDSPPTEVIDMAGNVRAVLGESTASLLGARIQDHRATN